MKKIHYFSGNVEVEDAAKTFELLARIKDRPEKWLKTSVECNNRTMETGKDVRKVISSFAGTKSADDPSSVLRCSLEDVKDESMSIVAYWRPEGKPLLMYKVDDRLIGGIEELHVKPQMTGDDFCSLC